MYLSEDGKSVVIIDQRKLPNSLELLTLSTAKEMYDAIKSLAVRGAPAIGICAGYSIYCLARQIETEEFEEFYEKFKEYSAYLNSSRPTAVNLSWALNRMDKLVVANKEKTVAEIVELMGTSAEEIYAKANEIAARIINE